jgi:hypothetical protein
VDSSIHAAPAHQNRPNEGDPSPLSIGGVPGEEEDRECGAEDVATMATGKASDTIMFFGDGPGQVAGTVSGD